MSAVQREIGRMINTADGLLSAAEDEPDPRHALRLGQESQALQEWAQRLHKAERQDADILRTTIEEAATLKREVAELRPRRREQ